MQNRECKMQISLEVAINQYAVDRTPASLASLQSRFQRTSDDGFAMPRCLNARLLYDSGSRALPFKPEAPAKHPTPDFALGPSLALQASTMRLSDL
jgi:hypothetical protein